MKSALGVPLVLVIGFCVFFTGQEEYAQPNEFRKTEEQTPTESQIREEIAAAIRFGVQAKDEGRLADSEEAFVDALGKAKLIGETRQEATSSFFLGVLCVAQERNAEAESYYEVALDGFKKLGLMEEWATAANNLAQLYQAQARYDEANALFAQATLQWLGLQEDRLLVQTLNNWASLKNEVEDYDQAEALYSQAIELGEASLDSKDPLLLTVLLNKAWFYKTRTRFAEAEGCYRRALTILENWRDWDDPDVAVTAGNLGEVLFSQKKYDEAETHLQHALEILSARGQDDGLDVAILLHNLATAYLEEGKYAQAEPLLLRLSAIDEDVLGPAFLVDLAKGLERVAAGLEEDHEYTKSSQFYRHALEIRSGVQGSGYQDVRNLNSLGVLYLKQGQYAEAESVLSLALEMAENTLDSKRIGVVRIMANLADSSVALGEYARAEALYKRALGILEQTQDSDHPLSRTISTNLAALYMTQARYSEAEQYLQRSVELAKQISGEGNHELGSILSHQGRLWYLQGKYSEALATWERAREMVEADVGSDHPDSATVLGQIASAYSTLGRFSESETLFRRALEIRERILGPDHPDTAVALGGLAGLLRKTGHRYTEAESLFRRALDIRERALGENHLDTAEALGNLGSLLGETGRYNEAESLFRRALDIRERVLGPNHIDVAEALEGLASLFQNAARYDEAESLFRRVLDIRERALGVDHPDVGSSLANIAELQSLRGRYGEAEIYCHRALNVLEHKLGASAPAVADVLNTLGGIQVSQNRFQEAEPNLRRALNIREQCYPMGHPKVATSLNNLSNVYRILGRLEKASESLERAVEIRRKFVGAQDPELAIPLNNLGILYEEQGRYSESESVFEEALKIARNVDPTHPDVALSMYNLSLLRRYQVRQQFGPYADKQMYPAALMGLATAILDKSNAHPQTKIWAHAALSRDKWDLGDRRGAVADLEEALRGVEELRVNASGGDLSKTQFFESFHPLYDLMVAWQVETGDVQRAVETAERGRARALLDQLSAVGLDLLATVPAVDRGLLEKRLAQAKARLTEHERRLNALSADAVQSPSEVATQIDKAREELAEAQLDFQRIYGEIKNASPLWRDLISSDGQPVSLANIQRQLVPRDGLLLYYVMGVEQSYLFVIPPAGGSPHAFPLQIDEAVAQDLGIPPGDLTDSKLLQLLTGTRKGESGPATVRDLGKFPKLEHMLWRILIPAEIRSELLHAPEVVVIPDGPLDLLAFESLVVRPPAEPDSPVQYWLDQGPVVRYASSASTLYSIEKRPGTRIHPGAAQIAALSLSDPIYDPSEVARAQAALEKPENVERGGQGTASTARDAYELFGGVLSRLPGTARESQAIRDAFLSAGSRTPVMLLQDIQASERGLRANLADKRYLHLATHGLVGQAGLTLFSALAMTPPPQGTARSEDDGFLQLYEIYDLKLPECELAVLSACETNVGEEFDGEGVFGLSRGFLAAGARRVVASQWAVDDESTAVLIGHFFRHIAGEESQGRRVDYARALRDAKLAVRRDPRWSDPYFWAPFVLIGKR